MKKRYRAYIDYEVEIKEKIQVPDSEEISPGKLDKMRQIMDAFIQHPDIMCEYQKIRFYESMMLLYSPNHEIKKLLNIKTVDKIFDETMISIGRHLPPETAAYLISLFCTLEGHEYEGTLKDLDREFNLILNLLGELIPIGVSFEEAGDRIKVAGGKPVENAGIRAGELVIGQMLPNGEILLLQGLGIQSCGFSGDK
jgi:hypothetical protein